MRPRIVEYLESAGAGWLAQLVPTPGTVYVAMVLVVGAVFLRRCVRSSYPLGQALEAGVCAGLGALIGTRLFYLVTTGAITETGGWELLSLADGTASWGVYVGAAMGFGLYAALTRTEPWAFLDVAAATAGLGMFVGRWSCLLAGDDFGRVTDWAFGIRFPEGSYPYLTHVARGELAPAAELSLPVYPLQVMLSLNGLLLFIVFTLLWRRWRAAGARIFWMFLIAYGVTRFPLEFLRDPEAGGASSWLSTSQWMCLALVLGGGVGTLWARQGRHRSVRPGEAN